MNGHIEIDGGLLQSVTVTDAAGSRPVHAGIGDYFFFVTVVGVAGGRLCLWSGFAYSDAIREAEAARCEFGISGPVIDIVVGGADGR